MNTKNDKNVIKKSDRYYNAEGLVGVLYSPGYGAGWYSWNFDSNLLFSPTLIQMVLDGRIGGEGENSDEDLSLIKSMFPDAYIGGATDLYIKWLKPGTRFRIDEYDGAEDIIILGEEDYEIA